MRLWKRRKPNSRPKDDWDKCSNCGHTRNTHLGPRCWHTEAGKELCSCMAFCE